MMKMSVSTDGSRSQKEMCHRVTYDPLGLRTSTTTSSFRCWKYTRMIPQEWVFGPMKIHDNQLFGDLGVFLVEKKRNEHNNVTIQNHMRHVSWDEGPGYQATYPAFRWLRAWKITCSAGDPVSNSCIMQWVGKPWFNEFNEFNGSLCTCSFSSQQ